MNPEPQPQNLSGRHEPAPLASEPAHFSTEAGPESRGMHAAGRLRSSDPMSLQKALQVGLVCSALLVLGTGLIMALVSLNSVIEIWFEYQWAPVARFVLGLLLAGLAVAGLFALTRRQR